MKVVTKEQLRSERARYRAALERIAAECGPEPGEICPCLDCHRELHAWMIAREALAVEEDQT